MTLVDYYKSYSNKQPLKARILLVLFIILMTLAILRALLPVVIKEGAHYWFESNNIKSEIGKIEISLFDGSLAINNVSGKSPTGKNFSLGQFKVIWHWKPLFNKTAFIKHVEVNGLKADAAFYKDGNMNIAGLVIKPNNNKIQDAPAVDKEPSTPWKASVETIKFSEIEFCLQQYNEKETPDIDYCVTLASFNWNGNINFKPSIQDQTPNIVPLYINGSLILNDIAVKNNQLKLDLLKVKTINIQDINIETLLNINVAQIGINNLTALQRHNKANDAQLVSFDQLSIQPISLLELNNLKLGTIKLDGTQAYLYVDKNGHTDLAKWLPKKDKEKPAVQAKVKTKDKPFNFAFNKFIFNTGKHVIFVDDSLKEQFSADIHTIDLKLSKLDSHTPNIPSHANLSLKIAKHGTLTIDTDLTLLAKKPSMKGKGKILGLDLIMLAPFIRKHIGHNIKSGQLDAELKLGIKKGVIESNMALLLRHLELKELNTKEAEELNNELGFPLNSALFLLRDRDNTIRLNIPVNGNTANPEFDPSDAIYKASSSAMSTAVVQYYTPFGLVFAAGALVDLATALNFEPVIFDTNMATLTPAHHEQLNKLATLMTERPSIHLTLCGISNAEDENALFPEEDVITKEKLKKLKELAESRSSSIKNYLVNNKAVKASRLIGCSPEFEKEEISGVKISI